VSLSIALGMFPIKWYGKGGARSVAAPLRRLFDDVFVFGHAQPRLRHYHPSPSSSPPLSKSHLPCNSHRGSWLGNRKCSKEGTTAYLRSRHYSRFN